MYPLSTQNLSWVAFLSCLNFSDKAVTLIFGQFFFHLTFGDIHCSLNPDGAISFLNGKSMRLLDLFVPLESNISSLESDANVHVRRELTFMDRLTTIWKSLVKIKRESFQAVTVSVLLYGCTSWTFNKYQEKKIARLELHKDTASCFEQILETTS